MEGPVHFRVMELSKRPTPGTRVEFPDGKRVYVRDVGIPGVEPPEKACDDPLCPWHGHLKVRFKTMEVVVDKVKMNRGAVVVHEWVHYVPKYKRYERRRRRIHVRVPPCIDVRPGDKVVVAETRPLAKTIAWVVIGKRD